MSGQRKKPGPKPSGRAHKRPMSFTITEEHREWLNRLGPGERSKWLGVQIDRAMEEAQKTRTSEEKRAASRAADGETQKNPGQD